jgi:hypothetical protein
MKRVETFGDVSLINHHPLDSSSSQWYESSSEYVFRPMKGLCSRSVVVVDRGLWAVGTETQRVAALRNASSGDGGFVIEFGGVCYQDTYPMYLTCIVHVSCMYLDVSRQDTSRYIEIQQDTFVSVTLAIIGNVSYLRISILLYDTFRIQ